MTARDALPLLYGLCDEWTARSQIIAALGGKPDHLTEALTPDSGGETPTPSTSPGRHTQIAALAAALA